MDRVILRAAWREHRLLLVVLAIYVAAAFALLAHNGLQQRLSLSIYQNVVPLLLAGYLGLFLLAYAAWIIYVRRPDSLRSFLRSHLLGDFLHPRRVVPGLFAVLAVTVALSVYTSIKAVIPRIVPFHLDADLAMLDATLHAGRQPWEWLQPLVGSASVTRVLGASYHLWFVAVYLMLFWQAFSRRDPRLRMQFLVTFVLVWALLGSAGALLWSSAGPCYYAAVTGAASDPYGPLLAYLHRVDRDHPLFSLELQSWLWNAYRSGGTGIGSGISAMPSIHNAMMWLLVLLGWRTRAALGIVLTVYAMLVLMGSVHLAWHYAVDAYVAIACTFVLWQLVGWLLERLGSAPDTEPADPRT